MNVKLWPVEPQQCTLNIELTLLEVVMQERLNLHYIVSVREERFRKEIDKVVMEILCAIYMEMRF